MKIKNLIVLGASAFAFLACDKEEVTNTDAVSETVTNNRAAAYEAIAIYNEFASEKDHASADFYNEMAMSRTQHFYVGAGEPFTLTTDGGTTLSSTDGEWKTLDGMYIEGEVHIEFIGVFNKADMVLLDKATSGVSEDGTTIDALISGGEVFVRATTAWGDEVELVSGLRVKVPTTTPDYDMIKFVEADVRGDDLVWEVADDKTMDVEEDREKEGDFVTAFDILPGEWGWTNIDKWAGDPCAKTEIFVDVPAGYDATNTEVYLSYDGDPGRLANFDMWDSGVEMFTEHYGQICLGMDCHFIAVTNAGGSLEYAIQAATITAGHIEVFTGFTPTTEAALIAAINALP